MYKNRITYSEMTSVTKETGGKQKNRMEWNENIIRME